MDKQLVCWKCGASLARLSLPLSRTDCCQACGAELHVCRLCKFYNSRVSDHCDEPLAGQVREVDRANFCDYFSPLANAYSARARQQGDASRAALEQMFGAGADSGAPKSGAAARAELDRLFGVKRDNDDEKD